MTFPKSARFGKFATWPGSQARLNPREVRRMYEHGFAGVYQDLDADAALDDYIRGSGGIVEGADAATAAGWAGSGSGKLSVPFVWVFHHFGACWPGRQGQGRGDCVSWCERNSNLQSYACEIQSAQPDEESGRVEGVPEIPADGIKDGCFSTEVPYWYRGHGSDGWTCSAAAKVGLSVGGLVTRDDHTPTLGLDLTRYNARTAGQWGRNSPPQSIQDATDNNLVRTATNVRSMEECRDFLANGYGISSCGSEGFSDTRDKNGVSSRRGSWAHAMAYIGYDDRDLVKRIYGGPLVLVLNSWAIWNSGPRDILESAGYVPDAYREPWIDLGLVNAQTGNLMIPHGAFWARASDVTRRTMIAKSSVNGWPRRALLTLGAEGNV